MDYQLGGTLRLYDLFGAWSNGVKPRAHNKDHYRERLSCLLVATCFTWSTILSGEPFDQSPIQNAVAPTSAERASRQRDLQKLLTFGQFRGLLRAVGDLNRAMRLVAENPMDKWRRERVQVAMAALPDAIRLLAGVFQANNLGNSKLPTVLEVLRGYVDVNAADNYNKFLKNPSPSLIPKLGSDFPKEYLIGQSESSQSLVMNENAPKAGVVSKKELRSDETEVINELANIESGLAAKKKRKPPSQKVEPLKLNPKFFNALPISVIFSALNIPTAYAKGASDENNENGGKAAEALFAMAAIIGAGAPMVVASIQANADKQIAKTNQQTAIATTQISADTSKYLAENQKAISEAQMATTQQISAMNNNETTKRLNLQLAELRAAREDNNKIQREKRDIEFKLNQERITLAQRQADDNVKLAKAALSAQISQAGLSQGLATTSSAGNRLNVNRSAGTAGGTSLASSTTGGTLSPRAPSRLGGLAGNGTGVRAAMSSRLLSALREGSSEATFNAVTKSRGIRKSRLRKGRRGIGRGYSSVASVPAMSWQLRRVMQSNLDVIGSSAQRRAGSDLSAFNAQVSLTGGEGYAAYRKRAVAAILTPELVPHAEVKSLGGYNRPAMTLEGSTHSLSNNGRGFFNLPRR